VTETAATDKGQQTAHLVPNMITYNMYGLSAPDHGIYFYRFNGSLKSKEGKVLPTKWLSSLNAQETKEEFECYFGIKASRHEASRQISVS
jgi:hypothetical protein